ncbi:hypothetical protein ACFX12_037986 [Malus domestica]
MWWEAQQVQHEGYWQPYEEFYSGPMQPPQPHIQYAQSNSDSSIDYNQILNELNSRVQGSQQEEYLPPSEELLLQYFYEGLLPLERQMLDASVGGALVDKTPRDAKTLIANRALNA